MPPSSIPPELFTRVDQWAQEVVRCAEQHSLGRTRSSGNGMKLRSLPARRGLAEISVNPHSRKRKPSITLDGTNKATVEKKVKMNSEPPKQRGRPPRSKDKAKQVDDNDDEEYNPLALPTRSLPSSIPDLPPPGSSANPSSPSRKSASPRKRRIYTLDKARSEAGIDMAYLTKCTPAVQQTDMEALKASGHHIPPAVLSLYEKIEQMPAFAIPSELESSYNNDRSTPRKTKTLIPACYYLPPTTTPYPSRYHDRLKTTVDKVFDKAKRAFRTGAHERQWGTLVSQLLFEVELWASEGRIAALNVENCSILPDEMRPTRPQGAGYLDLENQTASSRTPQNEAAESIGRMVDWSLGLEIENEDLLVIDQAWKRHSDNEFSLNQSISYISNYLLLADFEIKKKVSNRDPLVQLAIWQAGGLLKKRHHGWDTSMPMPGITITGHHWECFLFFELNGDLMMLGPLPFGTTSTLLGIWQILHGLHILMEWGQTEYLTWFKKHVIEGWARKSVRQ